jgi:hypothetical protein
MMIFITKFRAARKTSAKAIVTSPSMATKAGNNEQ